MAISFYGAIGLVGGSTGFMDDIEGSFLNNNDCCVVFVVASATFYFYQMDVDSGLTASSPDVIAPVNNAGDKRWILMEGSTTIGLLATAAEWSRQQNFNETAITSTSNATAWDLDLAQTAVHTLTENTTISAPTNMNAGACYVLRVVQAAGVYTLAFNAVFIWGTATASTTPAADGDVIILSCYSDGTSMYIIEVLREEA